MRSIRSLLLIAATAAFSGSAPAAPPAPERRDPPARAAFSKDALVEIPMLTFGGRPILQVTINGSGPYDFILDTGSPLTVIDAGLAQELKLHDLGQTTLGSPGGEPVHSMLTRIDKMEVSGVVIIDSPGEAIDLAGFFRSEGAPRGILSYAHFAGMLLTLDYPKSRLILRQGALPEPNGRDVLAYELLYGHIRVPITVAGKAMQAHLDTGSPSLLSLPNGLSDNVPFESEPTVAGRARLVGQEREIRAGVLNGSLQIGPRTFERPRITLMDGPEVANIGRSALEAFAVTIDQENQRIEFVEGKIASDGTVGAHWANQGQGGPVRMIQPAGTKRYGISFTGIGGDVLEVRGVEADSPAQRAGLEPGDHIVQINGKPTASLSTEDRMGALRASPLKLVVERGGETLELKMTLE